MHAIPKLMQTHKLRRQLSLNIKSNLTNKKKTPVNMICTNNEQHYPLLRLLSEFNSNIQSNISPTLHHSIHNDDHKYYPESNLEL